MGGDDRWRGDGHRRRRSLVGIPLWHRARTGATALQSTRRRVGSRCDRGESRRLEKDVAQRADPMEHQADDMEQRSSELADDVSDARDDWERKRRDPNVPGAPEPEEEADASHDAER